MELAVEARGVEKTFITGLFKKRRTHALKGVDLEVPSGAIFGLLGPNGAGKTTFLAILATLITPDRGTVKVLGRDVVTQAEEVRRQINMSSGHANFLWSLTVRENVEFYCMLYGLRGRQLHKKTDELIELFELNEFKATRFESCSTGTKQRLALAKALVNTPKILFLDEPTVGLDPDVSQRIRRIIKDLHDLKSMTILLTTHNMAEAEELCHEIALIKDGRIWIRGRAGEIKEKMHLGDMVRIRLLDSVPVPDFLGLPGIWETATQDGWLLIQLDDHRKRLQGILHRLASQGRVVEDLSIEETRLEDVFVRFVR